MRHARGEQDGAKRSALSGGIDADFGALREIAEAEKGPLPADEAQG